MDALAHHVDDLRCALRRGESYRVEDLLTDCPEAATHAESLGETPVALAFDLWQTRRHSDYGHHAQRQWESFARRGHAPPVRSWSPHGRAWCEWSTDRLVHAVRRDDPDLVHWLLDQGLRPYAGDASSASTQQPWGWPIHEAYWTALCGGQDPHRWTEAIHRMEAMAAPLPTDLHIHQGWMMPSHQHREAPRNERYTLWCSSLGALVWTYRQHLRLRDLETAWHPNNEAWLIERMSDRMLCGEQWTQDSGLRDHPYHPSPIQPIILSLQDLTRPRAEQAQLPRDWLENFLDLQCSDEGIGQLERVRVQVEARWLARMMDAQQQGQGALPDLPFRRPRL